MNNKTNRTENHFCKAFFALLCAAFFSLAGPLYARPQSENTAQVKLTVAAAASLEYSFVRELIPRFQKKYPHIVIEGVYDSSGRLQTQIESGLEADVFMSAAERQMDALKTGGFITPDTVRNLLQNRLVLIKPAGTSTAVTGFGDITKAGIIALGDPATTPAGQYAREAFSKLGNWEAVEAKLSMGNNVTEVLNWVAAGSAEVGVVYATDAATTEKVEVVAELPDGILSTKVIYPVGITTSSAHPAEAKLFVEFLSSEEGLGVFRDYGFSPAP
jgi:molybdate transport system substrate-binding protein